MVGFALAVLGEATTGKGALAQLNVETGVSMAELEPAVVGLVIFNLVAALLPASGRFEEEEDDTRQAGSLQVRPPPGWRICSHKRACRSRYLRVPSAACLLTFH